MSRRGFLERSGRLLGLAPLALACKRNAGKGDDGGKAKAPHNQPAARETTSAAGSEREGGKNVRVVLVRRPAVLGPDYEIREPVLGEMLDQAVTTLLGEEKPEVAWQRLLRPEDILGIKSNVWRFLPTPPELERLLVQRAEAAGIAPERIAVDDRGVRDNPVFRKASALINVRPLRTHHWSGVGSLIKNYIMFAESPPAWHGDSCADLAGLWQLPQVRGKTRLNILVMLTPLFHGKGPHHFHPSYTWPYAGLIVSRDPVAADAVGLRILQAKRREHFGRDEPLLVPPQHIALAEKRHRLGVADPARIELIKLGERQGMLI